MLHKFILNFLVHLFQLLHFYNHLLITLVNPKLLNKHIKPYFKSAYFSFNAEIAVAKLFSASINFYLLGSTINKAS